MKRECKQNRKRKAEKERKILEQRENSSFTESLSVFFFIKSSEGYDVKKII